MKVPVSGACRKSRPGFERIGKKQSAPEVLKLIRRFGERSPPKLIVLCGPSHSGKSSLANKLRGRFCVISSDETRKQVTGCPVPCGREREIWKAFDSLKREALKKGRDVVLDACHISKRARWHALQGATGHYDKMCIVFDLPWHVIHARCLGTKRLPVSEAERMWRAFQELKPSRHELKLQRYDEVYFIKG
ncbi:MAG: AAA family ATPase [bacterium]|nr:AAA family ATPase [bacterium]